MAQPVMQKSFNSGEWAPSLNSRVDIDKYHSGAALLRNFFVDYRGGASTRTGTQYILQAYKSNKTVRLISFQASTLVSYILELGDLYIRFYYNKAPILETAIAISAATQANPCQITIPTSTYAVGDWIFISSVVGMTQLNGNYYSIRTAPGGGVYTLNDLNGNAINSTAFSAYVSGGTAARIYTLPSIYTAAEVNQIKFAQQVNSMVLCHPNHPVNLLTLIAFNNWTLIPANFGTSAVAPSTFVATTTLGAGTTNYSYLVTTLDAAGDESIASYPISITNRQDLRTTSGSISISWGSVAGAVAYNIYKSTVSFLGVVPAGVPYGYIGQVNSNIIVDSNIDPNFSFTPPVGTNPFSGSGVASVTQNTTGTYTTVPSVYFTGGSPNNSAVGQAILQIYGVPGIAAAGAGYVNGDTVTLSNGVVLNVTGVGGGGAITSVTINNAGALTSGATPTNPVAQVSTSGIGVNATFNLVWGVGQTTVTFGGVGYQSVPAVNYNPAGATATAVLSSATSANPSVPGFFQQRLVLAAPTGSPETLDFSRPGSYYNYNISSPIQADDAISVTLASGQLETIKSIIATAPGLIVFTDKSSWLITGGSLGSAISASAIAANRQSYNGANDVPPILNNYDVLYVENKGSSVRDATYNYYAQIFTGSDISVVSSHLFYGYQITQWTWAQAPFKVVWALRSDGVLLALTFAKEEEFVAWSRHDTAGSFTSVASVPETIPDGMIVDAVYVVVQRTINGVSVQYIERMADRVFSGQAANAWCVDAALQYSGAPASSFTGAQQLAGATVTGLADGIVIPPFVMPVSGNFTLASPASIVTVGLPFTAQLQTLRIDTGEPTIQGKQKKINAVTVRCADTLGLFIGSDFSNLVAMKDLIVGNVGSMTNQVVIDLVTGDARTFIDPLWSAQGQFCIQQSLPLPATITGVIPQLTTGDTAK